MFSHIKKLILVLSFSIFLVGCKNNLSNETYTIGNGLSAGRYTISSDEGKGIISLKNKDSHSYMKDVHLGENDVKQFSVILDKGSILNVKDAKDLKFIASNPMLSNGVIPPGLYYGNVDIESGTYQLTNTSKYDGNLYVLTTFFPVDKLDELTKIIPLKAGQSITLTINGSTRLQTTEFPALNLVKK